MSLTQEAGDVMVVLDINRNLRCRAAIRRIVGLTGLLLICAFFVPETPLMAQERPPASDSAASSFGQQTSKKLALVIGNGAYRSLVALPNAINDANDVCAALTSIGFKTTCLSDLPTRRALREAIRLFAADAKAGAETFFFYAGHGLQYGGENYLIPTETQIWSEADIDFEGVGLSYLLQSLEQARSFPNVIVLDACRDNPFGQNARFRVEKGLARVEPPVGTVLIYATSPNKAALDGSGRNGLFTKHFLSHLSIAGIQLDEMLRQVSKGVEDEARNSYRFEQVPYRSSSYSGSYCLAGCEDPNVVDVIKAIETQRNELNLKLEHVSEENARLKVQAQAGADQIAKLEQHIARLAEQEKTKGLQSTDVAHDLERARAELAAVRAEQTRRDAVERENQRKMKELEGLRAELQRQAVEIEEYRRKIRELEVAKERSRGVEDGRQQRKEPPARPGVIVPSF